MLLVLLPAEAARTIRSSLTTDATKTLAQAFVGGWLDYCNSLLYGVSGELLRRLQSVQNAAARFITGSSLVLGNTITSCLCCATLPV